MPRNQPNLSRYKPNPIGQVRLTTRSATRARLYAGGTYFRSKDRGEQSNLLKIGVFEINGSGVAVIHNTVLKPEEMLSATGMSVPDITIFKLSLEWSEEIAIRWSGTEWRATQQRISRQLAFGPLIDLGPVTNGLFTAPNILFKVTGLASWSTTAVVYLRQRTREYTLVPLSVTNPDTMLVSIGWSIEGLRGALNGDATCWVSMPERGTAPPLPFTGPAVGGEDVQDSGTDADVLSAFEMTSLRGGDGLPSAPVGLNTGPGRVLVHLNYSERDDGSMGELNQIFEWVGDSATIGQWQRYA